MAKKNKKQPNHARLVVPGLSSKGGATPQAGRVPMQPAQPLAPDAADNATDNTIDLNKAAEPVRQKIARQKKQKRRMQALAMLLIFFLVLFVYFSGLYRSAVLGATDMLEGVRIAMAGGGSFPLSFEISGYSENATMGNSAVVVLGSKDLAIVSNSGRELYRFQHGYGNAHISAGNSRACVYSRGGNELVILGRDSQLLTRTTEREITFAEMSPNGALALVTSSRFRSVLQVYSHYADADAQLTWEITDEKPYAASFYSDNKRLAVACVSTESGVLHSNIYLLQTNKADVQATINGGNATVLDIQYLSTNSILVVYDSYAALYNSSGEEQARYDYGTREIVTMHSRGGVTALVFSAVSNNSVTTVMLDAKLAETGSFAVDTAEVPSVLVDGSTVYLLAGYEVVSYSTGGEMLNSYTSAYKGYTLAYSGQPLLLSAGSVEQLQWMQSPQGQPAGASSASSVSAGSISSGEVPSTEEGSLAQDAGAVSEVSTAGGEASSSLPASWQDAA